MRAVVVIPCRWGSSRLPGKPLSRLAGEPLIRHVFERAARSKEAARVVVTTDDPRIEKAVRRFGGEVLLSSPAVRTGSDRIAQVMDSIPADAYLNLQGDELILEAAILDDLITAFRSAQPLEIGTLKREIRDFKEVGDPNVVKVVTDREGFALYFSRSPIPHLRKSKPDPRRTAQNKPAAPKAFYKHLGIYIFTKDALKRFSSLPTGFLEDCEKLEQLRALENGVRIRVWETAYESLRVDTEADLKNAARFLKRGDGP